MTLNAAGIVATPALPCYNSCKAAEALCSVAFKQLGLAFPACPPQQIVYDLSAEGGTSVTANCTPFAQAPAQVSCPLSVVLWGKKCAIPSRGPNSQCTDADTVRALLITFGYIGLIECILVVVLTGANKKTMKWPGAIRLRPSARPHSHYARAPHPHYRHWSGVDRIWQHSFLVGLPARPALQFRSALHQHMPLPGLLDRHRHSHRHHHVCIRLRMRFLTCVLCQLAHHDRHYRVVHLERESRHCPPPQPSLLVCRATAFALAL